MEVVGGLAAILQLIGATAAALTYIDNVKGSVQERQALARETSTLRSLLTELDSRVRNHPTPSSFLQTALEDPARQLNVALKELNQLTSAPTPISAASSPRRSIRDLAWKMRWPTKKKTATELLRSVERAKIYISLVLQQEIWLNTTAIGQSTGHIEKDLEKLGLQVEDELRDKIISWMSPINFFVTQREIFSRFKTGTCEAIMGSPQLKLWMLGRGSRLLCCGIPGSGKTIFSALILQHLQDTQSANPDVKVAGIFCDYKETESQTPSNLLAAVWRQLTYDRTRLSDDAVGLYHANGKKGTRPNLSETTSVVTEELNRWQKVFVVIDAADECATGALAVILRVLELPHVNILVTSRTSGAGPFRQYASLSVQPTSLDLKLYVGSRIDESFVLLRHCEKDPSLRGEVIAAVVSKAKGMFLMARYHMDLIVGQDSVRRVRQALMSLPDELNAVYASMLDRVYSLEADRASRSRQLIALILFTTRPLTIDETRCALSIEPGDTCLNENDLPDLDVLLSACGGIIHVSSETQLLSFAHQTLAEYLLQAPPISSQTAHFMIARSCLTYVLFDSFAGGRCRSDDDLDARLRTHPLFLYSAQNWGMHTRTCGEAPDLHNLLNQLLYEKPKHRESSLQGLLLGPARFDGYSQTTPHQVPPLWLAAFFGLPAATLRLLGVGDGTAMVDSCASDGSTALSVAAKRGYTDVMAVLLDHGADVKTTGAVVVPLLEAAKRGQLEAASLLLQYGADVNARSSNGRSALHEAVVGGKEITALLLEKGADSESQTANFWGVLHSAVVAGDKDIVSQLIKKGASVYATTSDKETALHLAARRGLDSIVSLLLDAGADSKYIATDANGDTALHAAASHGHISTSTLLIQGGGDRINMPNTKGETPLYQAAMAGHTSVLDLLLANGADPTISDVLGALPLHQAAWVGCLPALLALRQSGQHHIDVADSNGRTCLHGAAAGGFINVVKYLIDEGADCSLRYGPRPLVLQKALRQYQNDPPRRRLLWYMMGQNKGTDSVTALDEASNNGHDIVAEVILSAIARSSSGLTAGEQVNTHKSIAISEDESIENLLSSPFPEGQGGGAYKRIRKELQAILNSVGSEDGDFVFGLPIESDLKHWIGLIVGPNETCYRGGLFWLNITFPNDYPWEPPRIRFETKIFHTNINNNGGISLNLLRSKKGDYTHESEWSPAYTIQKCLIVIRGLLQDPNEGFPEATHLFKTDRTRYYATVEGFTRKYAMGFDGAEG